jgi:hypothetical protein
MGTEELPGYAYLQLKARKSPIPLAVPLGGEIIEVVSPFRDGTTAGRLLSKRGEGGYMIIMQTEDAKKRREYIESKGLAKVITSQEHGDTVFVQYHPKGIKGTESQRSRFGSAGV